MIPQIKKNQWDCLITAFAIAVNRPASDLILQVGHDGSEIMSDILKEPWCRRGYTIQEILKSCLIPHGYGSICFEFGPQEYQHFTLDYGNFPLCDFITRTGVICGINARLKKGHSLAWENGRMCDPDTGKITEYTDPMWSEFIVTEFHWIIPLDK